MQASAVEELKATLNRPNEEECTSKTLYTYIADICEAWMESNTLRLLTTIVKVREVMYTIQKN